ncbi:beta-amyrin 28-monooxygenase-like [Magnolia sinica]|uniref:beta-amyrin 28-monooxygenase-like n=1 Tax=Magnolia sinica TaxID=86752 RepID=UPI00265922E4|nr:beta-amyrin 28-monooxygenase-like [Magnolia sinica]
MIFSCFLLSLSLYLRALSEHMEILKKRQPSEGKLTWSELQKMKYTWTVAQELMRFIPPVFGGFREALKDTSFGGYDIPKGWKVFWASSPTHMDKDFFADLDEFDPSRFQNPSKPIPPFSYIPFGAGAHMCIGNEFARVETLTIVHNMIMNFEWSEVNPDEMITCQPMPYPSMGLPIRIKERITSE